MNEPKCWRCLGAGKLDGYPDGRDGRIVTVDCPICKGTGRATPRGKPVIVIGDNTGEKLAAAITQQQEEPPVLRMPKMPSDSIIARNKLINDLLEMPSLSTADFKKGLALRSAMWENDKESIGREMAEQEGFIQQAKEDMNNTPMSGKELDAFCAKAGLSNEDWDEGGGFVHEAVVRVIRQAKGEGARGIFEEIGNHNLQVFVEEGNGYLTSLEKTNWYQSLKSEYPQLESCRGAADTNKTRKGDNAYEETV